MSAGSEALPVSAIQILRGVLSLLVLPVLYRALGEPGEGWGGSHASILRRLLFAWLGAFVFFSLTARWAPEEGNPAMGDAFEAYTRGVTQLRFSYTSLGKTLAENPRASPRETALKELKKAAGLLPESAQYRRAYGIALAHNRDYPRALKALDGAADVLRKRAPERASAERRLWHTLYGPEPPTRPQIEAARPQLDAYSPGWLGRVALLAAYQRPGKDAAPESLTEDVRTEAAEYALRVFAGGFGMALLLPQLGLISLVVGLILIGERVLRRAPPELHPVTPVLWESFILMFACGMIPSLLLTGGKRLAPETSPGLIGILIIAGDLAECLAVGYLWWRLRTRGFRLAEVGLSARGFGANLVVGVMAATILTPGAVLVGLATKFLSDRFFPNIAPPYHPLQGLTATSTSPEIRLALFFAAVVGAPLLEELFFRGVLYGALRRRFGIAAGLIGSAAFFAILHPQLPLGFLPIAFLGGAFAALYEWRQSLVPGMVAHAINNGVIFLLLNLMFPLRG